MDDFDLKNYFDIDAENIFRLLSSDKPFGPHKALLAAANNLKPSISQGTLLSGEGSSVC